MGFRLQRHQTHNNMNNDKTGGPAYPHNLVERTLDEKGNVIGGGSFSEQGMTLRDWFAGQMMAAMATPLYGKDGIHRMTAEACYRFADAMIEARKTK
jgi:hypothetical protein